jgi:bifunctional non-homologous end joining protein LigD
VAALDEYRRKRHPDRTPEPMPGGGDPHVVPAGSSFVIHEHHASSLHWDVRLEHEDVLVSWAVPKGVPTDPKVNRLAVHVEDHPLEYGTFEGHIGEGEYGAGSVSIWDSGTYVAEKWTDREVKVVLDGQRVHGRFVLFQTGGKQWMMHRMDAPPTADWIPLPRHIAPMLATAGRMPASPAEWAYEMKWDGTRASIRVEGGRANILDAGGSDVSRTYPELRPPGEQLGSKQVIIDGEIVVFDIDGRPDPTASENREQATTAAAARTLSHKQPAVFLAFDLLHLDGRSMIELPYRNRRAALEGLTLQGPVWLVPPYFDGDREHATQLSQDQGLAGLLAKRLDSPYRPGARSRDWIAISSSR